MTDTVTIKGGPSAEGVAFELLKMLINIEDKKVFGVNTSGREPDRKWLLDTYAECLWATTQRRVPPKAAP